MNPRNSARILIGATTTLIALFGGSYAMAAQAGDSEVEALYLSACAACHGAGGQLSPESPVYANFESPPADFTDPLFNSREPRADWAQVILYGGAALGLSSQMPAFEHALPRQQIDDLVEFIKGLADTSRYPPGELNFLRPHQVIKPFPEDEGLILQRFDRAEDGGEDALRSTLYYARRFGTRYQGEIKLVHVDEGERSELDELELGFKWTPIYDLERGYLAAFGIEAAIPFEDGESELLIPYTSFGKEISPSWILQSTLKARLPVDDLGGGEVELATAFHWMRSEKARALFPALELIARQPFDGAGDFEASIIPQAYVGLTKGGHVAFNLGVEIPLTDFEDDYRVHWYLLWDIADGPLWAGW